MITKAQLRRIAPYADDDIITDLEVYFNKYLEQYGINTYLRLCHFIAQAAHESDSFKTLEEYASGSAYEGRKDLGNTKTGDGKRFKGRGIFQLTGRANYTEMSDKLGMDLVGDPELAAEPEVSVLTALEFWNGRGLSKFADQDDVLTISKRINGVNRKTGLPNGLEDRKKYLARAKKELSVMDNDNVVLARRGESSDYVAELQRHMIAKGSSIEADGDFGPATESAVKELQLQYGLEPTGEIDSNLLAKLLS